MNQWNILDRRGHPMNREDLPERPKDSNPMEGEEFRPWYKEGEHLHVEKGEITGIHARGSVENIQSRLEGYLAKEPEILNRFGKEEDIFLTDIDLWLNG